MVRIGLCLYLMLTTLAGPVFCCCVPDRLAAGFARPVKQDSCNQGCCRHHRATGGQQHQIPKPAPNEPEQPTKYPTCPCQENGHRQIALPCLESETSRHTQSRHSLPGLMDDSPILPTEACLVLERGIRLSESAMALPFVAVEDILLTLHILRC